MTTEVQTVCGNCHGAVAPAGRFCPFCTERHSEPVGGKWAPPQQGFTSYGTCIRCHGAKTDNGIYCNGCRAVMDAKTGAPLAEVVAEPAPISRAQGGDAVLPEKLRAAALDCPEVILYNGMTSELYFDIGGSDLWCNADDFRPEDRRYVRFIADATNYVRRAALSQPIEAAPAPAPTPQQISDYLNGLDTIRREVVEREAAASAVQAKPVVLTDAALDAAAPGVRAVYVWAHGYPTSSAEYDAARRHVREMLKGAEPAPIDMVLHCPACKFQHIDKPDTLPGVPIVGVEIGWTNPPHKTHLCAACGHEWRPANVPTNGVEKLA